jgi:hypothetical protein
MLQAGACDPVKVLQAGACDPVKVLQAGACDPVKCQISVVLLPAGLSAVPAGVFPAAGEQKGTQSGELRGTGRIVNREGRS